jgi:hypothetical protein
VDRDIESEIDDREMERKRNRDRVVERIGSLVGN